VREEKKSRRTTSPVAITVAERKRWLRMFMVRVTVRFGETLGETLEKVAEVANVGVDAIWDRVLGLSEGPFGGTIDEQHALDEFGPDAFVAVVVQDFALEHESIVADANQNVGSGTISGNDFAVHFEGSGGKFHLEAFALKPISWDIT
jgi:hypothetical protein